MFALSRQRRGTGIAGCLVALALVLGLTVWGYFKFFHYAKLVNAGHNHQTFAEQTNWPAVLEYGRRVRTNFSVSATAMTRQNDQILRKFQRGEYDHNTEAFERETSEFIDLLLQDVTQFDSQQVPKFLDSPHIKISKAHGQCYETMVNLRAASSSQGAERTGYLRKAVENAKEATQSGNTGLTEFRRIWNEKVSGGN